MVFPILGLTPFTAAAVLAGMRPGSLPVGSVGHAHLRGSVAGQDAPAGWQGWIGFALWGVSERAPTAESGKSAAAPQATAAKVPAQADRDGVLCMVDRMEKRKATFLLSAHTLDAAKTVAQGGNMSAFVDRALRNETLRAQLATSALPELSGWLDDAETDQAPAA